MPDDENKPETPPEEAARAPGDAPEHTPKAEAEAAAAVEDAPVKEEDRFRPGAIAARMDSLGEETEVDRIAREEEKKLQERKKGKKGKRGLESAASKRLAKIGEGKVKRPTALGDTVTPDADPLLERTAKLSEWIKTHRQTFGGVLAIAVIGLVGFLGYTYWQGKHDAEASALLSQASADERGRVSDKDDDDEEDTKGVPMYPTFKTAAARRDAALAKYREVESRYSGTGAATLARLAEAGLLLDTGDGKAAGDAYADVKASPLAQADAEVRGRAIEGMGFAAERLAASDAGARDSHLDAALSAFKQLEQVEMKGFKELGMYHQARVLQAKGNKADALTLLKDVYKRVTDPAESHPFAYLETVVEDRLRELDPTALPPKTPPPKMGGPNGNIDMNDPRIQELIRQLQQQQGGGLPGAPGAPQ
ncbi:MAG TPA: tetratricopeptide repeat protein [Polyangiaceae bacterium]